MAILSLGEFLWSLLVIFFMVVYFMMLFQVIVDVFRRHDESGAKKALWLILLLIFPLITLLIYMVSNSEGMAERQARQVAAVATAYDTGAGKGSGGSATEIAKAKELLDSGAINQDEFNKLKANALAS